MARIEDNMLVFKGISVMEHAMTSIVGEAMFNGFSINHGYTPRRSYNTSNVTTAQLAEVVATLLGDLYRKSRTFKT